MRLPAALFLTLLLGCNEVAQQVGSSSRSSAAVVTPISYRGFSPGVSWPTFRKQLARLHKVTKFDDGATCGYRPEGCWRGTDPSDQTGLIVRAHSAWFEVNSSRVTESADFKPVVGEVVVLRIVPSDIDLTTLAEQTRTSLERPDDPGPWLYHARVNKSDRNWYSHAGGEVAVELEANVEALHDLALRGAYPPDELLKEGTLERREAARQRATALKP